MLCPKLQKIEKKFISQAEYISFKSATIYSGGHLNWLENYVEDKVDCLVGHCMSKYETVLQIIDKSNDKKSHPIGKTSFWKENAGESLQYQQNVMWLCNAYENEASR